MFHGLNSRIGHGTHLAAALAAEGFITVGFDHRGFGHSKDHSNFLTVDEYVTLFPHAFCHFFVEEM